MLATLILAGLLATQSTAHAEPSQFNAAYEDLAAGKTEAAIVHLERELAASPNNPALLINLGAAYARAGRTDDARAAYRSAVAAEERYKLQLADGSWADSRRLARMALASLEGGVTVALK